MELNYLAVHRLVVECVDLCVHRQGNDPLETDRNKTSILLLPLSTLLSSQTGSGTENS